MINKVLKIKESRFHKKNMESTLDRIDRYILYINKKHQCKCVSMKFCMHENDFSKNRITLVLKFE